MASYAASKEKANKKGVVHQLSDLFGSLLNIQVIESVAQSCNYNVEISSHHLLEMTSNIDDSPESPPVPIIESHQRINKSPKPIEVRPNIQSIPNSVSDGYLSQNLNSNPLHLPIISDGSEKQKDLEKVINGISQGYKILILMRGLPGSGKSHLGRFIIDATIGKKNYENHILSTDDYFMKNGKYHWDKTKLEAAHNWNQSRALKAMIQGVSPVIIDNTNTKLWEMRPYAMMGVDYGYYIEILEPNTPWKFDVTQLARKNKHGVPKDHLKDMLSRYQKDVTGYSLLCSYNLRYAKNKPPMFRKQPPLTCGANWFSCNNLTTAVNSQQLDPIGQQSWSTSTPQVNTISSATEPVNFMNFNEENSGNAPPHTPKQSDSQLRQSPNTKNFIQFHEQSVNNSSVRPAVETIIIEDDEIYVNTVDDILTCSPIGENNILLPHLVSAGSMTMPSTKSSSSDSKKFCLEKSLRNVESAWGINEEALNSWDIVMPIKEETIKPHTRTSDPNITEVVDITLETKDSCCNTEGIEFELHKRENLPNGYKLLYAANRNINSNMPTKTVHSIPKKLKLDKSCSVNSEELETSNSADHMQQLRSLFPSIPKKFLLEIYQKCKGDFDWTVDVLLEANSSILLSDDDDNDADDNDADDEAMMADINRVTKIEPEMTTDEQKTTGQDYPNFNQYQHDNTESTCSMEIGCDSNRPEHVTSIHSSPSHTSSSKMELEEPKACTSRATPSDTAISSDSESDSDSGSESTEPDEMVELNLGDVLVNQLEAKFENELPGYPKGFHPVVQVPLSLAKQLFAFYLESVYQQVDAQNKILDTMVKQDEDLARQLDEQEKQKFGAPREKVDDLPSIMDEQIAQRMYQKENNEWKNLSPETLAVKLTRQKLYSSFPSVDQDAINEILHAHDYDFNQTVEDLLNSVPTQFAGSIVDVKKAPITKDVVEEMKQDMEISSIPDTDSRQTGDQYRQEANVYQTKRNELRQKAQNFYQRGMTEVAQFYSELASKQTSNLERANSWAAMSFLNEHADKLQKFDHLDLHFLYTKEAKPAVDLFIDRHINLLRESREGKKYQELYIVTGRGKNSENGKPRLKPVVISRLKKRNISYVHLNPGLLKIKITRNTRMTSDVP